ncbi:MAG: sle [Myxococcaceae bacterium]|nr:sle [Myxococcaceae bacterium]
MKPMPIPSLTSDELTFFKANGYLAPIKICEPEEMVRRWKTERLKLMDRSAAVYQHESVSGNTNISNYDRHLDSQMLAEHVCAPEIVGRVRSVLGGDVICWRSEFFPKYPGDEGTDWHQADTFANASGKPQIIWPQNREFGGTITVWTAFTDATIETGCLQFIPGTNEQMFYDETKGMVYNPNRINSLAKEDGVRRGFFGYDYRELQIDPSWEPDVSRAVSIELKPGEAVMFWSTLMHASHPHVGKTKNMRLGFVARYVPTCVKVYPDTEEFEEYGGHIELSRYGTVVVSGRDQFGHNRVASHTTRGFPFVALP